MRKAIFWDNDGVLVDTEHLYFKVTRDVLASAGIPLTEQDYLELFLVQGKGAWHLAEEHGLPPADVDRLRTRRNTLYADAIAEAPRLLAGVSRVLDALHGKYVMGVVTSSRKDHFDVIHRNTGILRYFDFVLTADDYPRTKPEPDPYLRAIEKSGIAREHCVAIEDSERGLAAARGAGVDCIIVPTALTRACTFTGAYRILKSLDEVPAIL